MTKRGALVFVWDVGCQGRRFSDGHVAGVHGPVGRRSFADLMPWQPDSDEKVEFLRRFVHQQKRC